MNRRRHATVVPVAQIATWVLLLCFVAGAGVVWVYNKNQLHAGGTQIKELERDLQALQTSYAVVQSRVAELKSHDALLKKRESRAFLTDYVSVTAENTVRVVDAGLSGESDLRPVANRLR